MTAENLSIQVLSFSFFIIFSFVALFAGAVFNYKRQNQKRCLCPYTKKPMWPGEVIPLSSVEKIMHFLYYDIHSYDNRVFPMKKAMVCRDTGKIFADTVSFWGFSKVDWTFIQKKHRGSYVSWGSLSLQQQREVREVHGSLEGFQTETSSSKILPKDCEELYAHLKPGPLYVDIETNILIGWMCVPDTMFEVLIVRFPRTKMRPRSDQIQKYYSKIH